MNTSEPTPILTEEQQREERFRHQDLSHPLIQMLYSLRLEDIAEDNQAR